jgi:hypothetical protein
VPFSGYEQLFVAAACFGLGGLLISGAKLPPPLDRVEEYRKGFGAFSIIVGIANAAIPFVGV